MSVDASAFENNSLQTFLTGLLDASHSISLDTLIGADIAAASVLISMGALLGRTTPFQLLLMGLIEIFVFALNEYLQLEFFKVCPSTSLTEHF